MKRIISVLAAMLLVAAMLVAMAMPAFADILINEPPKCEKGNNTAFFGPGWENRNGQASESLNKVFGKCQS